MSIRRIGALAASLVAITAWAPAHATTQATVTAGFVYSYNNQVGGGWLVTVGCKGVAGTTPSTNIPPNTGAIIANTEQVAVATTVTCKVITMANSPTPATTTKTQVTPGSTAATQITLVAPLGQVMICSDAASAIMDVESNRLYLAEADEVCFILPNT